MDIEITPYTSQYISILAYFYGFLKGFLLNNCILTLYVIQYYIYFRKIPVFSLGCNLDPEAAEIAYNEIERLIANEN